MPFLYKKILCSVFALLCLLYSMDAEARLSAEASLNYSNYNVQDRYGSKLSGHSLTQDYSLLYDTRGRIYNSRIGQYEFAVGYNWSGLDTTIKGNTPKSGLLQNPENFNEYRGHIFYNGEIIIDPKEMPFRLNAYSRDLTRNSIVYSETPLISDMFIQNRGMLLGTPNLAIGIDDGIRIDSGATLVAGVKNGMTNGYNEILRHFPMIMLDYRDQVTKDLRSITPVDTRLSRLAFVSLNKKDNWFHYRFSTYKDNINNFNNYDESQIQIGTIDQHMSRRWIDFSNWIQVSADLQLTRLDNYGKLERSEEVALNLFGMARRSNWELRTFNYFERYREESGRLTYTQSLPLYVSGILNPDVSWRTRASYKDTHDTTGARLTSVLGGYRVDAFKRALFSLAQYTDVESSSANNADLLVFSTGLETTSSPRFSRQWTLGALYQFKDTINKSAVASTDFFVHKTILQAGYQPNNVLRIAVRQETELTHGTNQRFTSAVRDVNTSIPQYEGSRLIPSTYSGESTLRSSSNITASWNPMARWRYSLSASEEIATAKNSPTSSLTNLSASVDHSNTFLQMNNTLSYTSDHYSTDSKTSTLSDRAMLTYIHSRNLNSKLSFSYFTSTLNGISSSGYDAEQQLNYIYYSYTGVARKLFEISEVATYSNSPNLGSINYYGANSNYNYNTIISSVTGSTSSTATTSARGTRGTLSLGAKFYPLRQLTLAAGGRYLYDNTLDNYSLLWYTSISANYKLLQTSLDYYQGKRQSDGLLEKKFTANVRKLF